MDADVIVVGAGLAGLVAAAELADAGRRVLLLDQEGEQSLGGQAFWSFGGLFFVNSPEQRRLRRFHTCGSIRTVTPGASGDSPLIWSPSMNVPLVESRSTNTHTPSRR